MIALIFFKASSEDFLGTGLNSIYPFFTPSLISLMVYPALSAKYEGIIPFIVTMFSVN